MELESMSVAIPRIYVRGQAVDNEHIDAGEEIEELVNFGKLSCDRRMDQA